MEDPEELQALRSVLASFYHYEQHARDELLTPKRRKLEALTLEEQALVPWLRDYIATLENCIRHNGEFCRVLSTRVAKEWGITEHPSEWGSSKYADYEKVKYLFKQIAREWSTEGRNERDVAFSRFFDVLQKEFPVYERRQAVKILVPGVGLARLTHELVKLGFSSQGNEFSYHMLLASNYILNMTYSTSADSVFPFIHSTSNQVSRNLQTRPIFFPDEHPASILDDLQTQHPTTAFPELMSIASGSFPDLYGPSDLSLSRIYSNAPSAAEFRHHNRAQFDCVITNFFIDTAPNVIDYLRTLHHCISPGGIWMNFGPLLWHFEDSHDDEEIIHPDGTKHVTPVQGLELTLEEIIVLVEKWFVIEKQESGIECAYAADARAMGGWRYKCAFWVARRRED